MHFRKRGKRVGIIGKVWRPGPERVFVELQAFLRHSSEHHRTEWTHTKTGAKSREAREQLLFRLPLGIEELMHAIAQLPPHVAALHAARELRRFEGLAHFGADVTHFGADLAHLPVAPLDHAVDVVQRLQEI